MEYEIEFKYRNKEYIIQLARDNTKIDIEIFDKEKYIRNFYEFVKMQNKCIKKKMTINHLADHNTLQRINLYPQNFIGVIYKIFDKTKILRVIIYSKLKLLIDYMTMDMMVMEIKDINKNNGNIVVVNDCGFVKVC